MNTLTFEEMKQLEGGWPSWDCVWAVGGLVGGVIGMVGGAASANPGALYMGMWFFSGGIIAVGKECY